jgi:diaminopimelate epimerase
VTRIPFLKMHGAANDFVVVDHREPFLAPPLAPLLARLCDRRRGIGADGVLLLERDPNLDFAMRYFNADGRPADFCGNGARCIARFALERGLGRDGAVRFATAAGPMRARGAGGGIELHFGRVERAGEPVTVEAAGRSFTGRLVRPGVPHFVVPADDVGAVPLAAWGPALRRHPAFGPEGANVDFVAALGAGRVALRTHERGVEGETLACGSGAMAAALAAAAGGARSPVTVRTAGGDDLVVSFEASGESAWDVTLIGPAEVAFEGVWMDAR